MLEYIVWVEVILELHIPLVALLTPLKPSGQLLQWCKVSSVSASSSRQ